MPSEKCRDAVDALLGREHCQGRIEPQDRILGHDFSLPASVSDFNLPPLAAG